MKKRQELMEKTKKDKEGMAAKFAAETANMDAKMKEMEEKVKSLRDLAGTKITIPIYK